MISLLVWQGCLHLWVPKRNAWALQCWTCGEWLKSAVRVWKSSARQSGKSISGWSLGLILSRQDWISSSINKLECEFSLLNKQTLWLVSGMCCDLFTLTWIEINSALLPQLQIMPSQVTLPWYPETKPPGPLPDPKHPQAFLKETWQLPSGRVQLKAQIPDWTGSYWTFFGLRNVPSEPSVPRFHASILSCTGHRGEGDSNQWKLSWRPGKNKINSRWFCIISKKSWWWWKLMLHINNPPLFFLACSGRHTVISKT